MNKSQVTVIVATCMVVSFLYGVLTVQYKIFPYDVLRTVKHLVNPPTGPEPERKLKPVYSDSYYHRKSFFEMHGRHDYDVVFIGDSLTEEAEWEDLFPSLKIANRGIGGDRTDGVIKRMSSIYSTNAKKAFIMAGTNDFAIGVEVNDVLGNYRRIIKGLVRHGMQPYIQSTLLVGNQYAARNRKITALNQQLRNMAAGIDGVTFIDLNTAMANGSLLDSRYSRDGIHLNGKGYAVWRDTIKGYLQSLPDKAIERPKGCRP